MNRRQAALSRDDDRHHHTGGFHIFVCTTWTSPVQSCDSYRVLKSSVLLGISLYTRKMHALSMLIAVFCCATFCGAQELVLDPASNEISGRVGGAIAISCTAIVPDGSSVNMLMWHNPDGDEITATDRMNVQVAETNPLEQVVSLTINSLESTDAGAYTCMAVIEGVTLEEVVTLVIHETLTLEAESLQYIIPGEDSLIQCFVGSGYPVPDIKWTFETEPIEEGDRYEFTDDGLTVKNVDATVNGTYVCSAGIPDQGQDTFSRIEVKLGNLAEITELSNVEAELGEQVVLTCKATGHPTPVVTWISQYGDEDDSDEDDSVDSDDSDEDDSDDSDDDDDDHQDGEGKDENDDDKDADHDGDKNGDANGHGGEAGDETRRRRRRRDDENGGNGKDEGADDDDDAKNDDVNDDDADDDGEGNDDDDDGDAKPTPEPEPTPKPEPSSKINSTISAKGEVVSQLIIDNVNKDGLGEYICVAENALGRTTAKAKLTASSGTRCALSIYGMLASLLILLRCSFW